MFYLRLCSVFVQASVLVLCSKISYFLLHVLSLLVLFDFFRYWATFGSVVVFFVVLLFFCCQVIRGTWGTSDDESKMWFKNKEFVYFSIQIN
ncbi:hypothetical protein Hdeb2414_s0030g00708811 [Helianthus debilis subsp. tardiflorus]